MKVQDIKIRVKRIFGDESGVQLTDEDILRWINDGQRHVVKMNEGLLEAIAKANTVKNQQEYDLPIDVLILRSVHFKYVDQTSYFHLKGYSFQEFNEFIDGWDGSDYSPGIPVAYTIYADKIIFFPIPDRDITDAIKIYYHRKPTEVTGDLDEPDLPELYHETLVKFCVQKAYEMDEDLEAAAAKSNELTSDIQLLRGRSDSWKNEEVYPTITVLHDDWGW